MGGCMTKVLPGLYVGALENTKNEEELMANGISHILVVQSEKCEIEKSPGRHFLQVVVNEQDNRALYRCLTDTNDFVHATRVRSDNVLVCSDSGMSASVAVVAAYLMSLYRLDSRSAVSVVQGLRHAANPVASLQDQLEQLETNTSIGNGAFLQSPPGQSSAASTIIPGASQSQSIIEMEHDRLIKKFGKWPRLEEDSQCIRSALESFKKFSDSGFYLYDPEEPSTQPKSFADQGEFPEVATTAIPVSEDSILTAHATKSGITSNCRISLHDENAPDLFDAEPFFETSVQIAPSSNVFGADSENSRPHGTVRLSGSKLVDEGLEPDEIGLEMDETIELNLNREEEDDDDIPGAIAMPQGGNMRRSVAASYHHAGLSSRNLGRHRMGYSLTSRDQYHTNVGSVSRNVYQQSIEIPTVIPTNPSTNSRLSTTVPVRQTFW